jgi:hypothetical protein
VGLHSVQTPLAYAKPLAYASCLWLNDGGGAQNQETFLMFFLMLMLMFLLMLMDVSD